jgi:hypothetical protein
MNTRILQYGTRFFHTLNCRLPIPSFKHPYVCNFRDLTHSELRIKDLPKETIIYVARCNLKNALSEFNNNNLLETMMHAGDATSHLYLALSRYIKFHERLNNCSIDFNAYREPLSSKESISNKLEFLIKDLNKKHINWGKFNICTLSYSESLDCIKIYRSHLVAAIKDLVQIQNAVGDINLTLNKDKAVNP